MNQPGAHNRHIAATTGIQGRGEILAHKISSSTIVTTPTSAVGRRTAVSDSGRTASASAVT